MNNNAEKNYSTIAYISLISGIIAVFLMLITLLLGVFIRSLGMLMIIRGMILPVAITAIVLGVIAQNGEARNNERKVIAITGLVLGIFSAVLLIITIFGALFFVVLIPFRRFIFF